MNQGNVIVTAGCAGIGGKITRSLLESGYTVFPTTRSKDNGDEFAERLAVDLKTRCHPLTLSMETEQAMDAFCEELRDEKIYALVNCAANRDVDRDPFQCGFSEWEKNFKIDVFATAYLSELVAKKLIRENGRIVNISSVYSINIPDYRVYDGNMLPTSMIYGAAKASINYLTRFMAVQFASHAITVNAILPGGVENPKKQTPFFQNEYKKRTPMGRMAYADEFNQAVCYFLSEGSAYCTGQLLTIDGGWSLL